MKSEFIIFQLGSYLEGVRARVWVDDVAAHVDLPRPIFLKMLSVDPLIHLQRQSNDGEDGLVAMSLASLVRNRLRFR